jgi:hypothetical protein
MKKNAGDSDNLTQETLRNKRAHGTYLEENMQWFVPSDFRRANDMAALIRQVDGPIGEKTSGDLRGPQVFDF